MDTLVKKLTDELAILQAEFQKAMDEKNAAEAEASKCARRLDSAQRLVNALGSESERWNQAIIDLGEKIFVITGDVLLASAFVLRWTLQQEIQRHDYERQVPRILQKDEDSHQC